MAGFSDLPTLLTDAKREAMIADMTCHGWDYEGGHLKTKGWSYTNPYGGGAETWEVTISITGEIVDRGAAKDDIPERCATAVKQAIASWDTAIEDAA